jgi:ABC-type histidine transport system ATPase subunit
LPREEAGTESPLAIEIRVDDLHKSFGTGVVLNGVSFTIGRFQQRK